MVYEQAERNVVALRDSVESADIAVPIAAPSAPRRLLRDVWFISGDAFTHPWDACSYLITGTEPTLIDCGSALGYPAMKRALGSLGYRPQDVKTVLATHGHWDHVSGMAQLRQESNARLFMHEADRAQVESGDYDRTAAYLYGESFPPVRVDGALRDGDVLPINGLELRIFHTPGHTPGSVCFWTEAADEGGRKTRLLIAGDTVWGGYSPRVGSDLDAWVGSLDRLLQLEFDVITFGHWSAPILDAKAKVTKAREQFCALFNPWFRLNEWY